MSQMIQQVDANIYSWNSQLKYDDQWQSSLCEIILGESTFDLQNVAVSALLIKTMVLVLCWAGADTTVLLTSGRKSAVSLCPVQRRRRRRRFPHFISACIFLDFEELRQQSRLVHLQTTELFLRETSFTIHSM